ncbi:ABC transporter permease [Ferruginibacter sp.]
MQTIIPSTSKAITSLLRADFTTQWRNRRSVILIVLVPCIILSSWKGIVDKLGGAFVLSNCITIGLTAIGLMGYANSIARDRDKGVFQRLRVAPLSSWSIMASRLTVQLAMIFIVTLAVFIAGFYIDKITVSVAGYIVGAFAAVAGGALYLSIGQVIVGRIKNPETVNSTCRLVYFAFIMVGMFGELGMLGDKVTKIVKWSPYGVVRHLVSASLRPDLWNMDDTVSLLICVGYTIVFATLGIKWFKWSNK